LLVLAIGVRPAIAPAQQTLDVRIAFETQDEVPFLRVFASTPFTIDLRALHLTVQRYAGFDPDSRARPTPLNVEFGPAASDSAPIGIGNDQYHVPFKVVAPPKPGMYVLSAETAPGFARDRAGNPLPQSRFPTAGIGQIAAWWPDEHRGDKGLRDASARFAHRTIHAFGGTAFSCKNWGMQLDPQDAIGIGSVARDLGHASKLETGATWTAGEHGFPFIAFDPLVFHVAIDRSHLPAGVPVPSCDYAYRYADPWHIDISVTTARPPKGLTRSAVRIGMSRDDVVWTSGYPDAYGTAASFRTQDRWDYDAPTPFSWWVEFKHDRVVAMQKPGSLP
jgi:hypothetical protein